jgi:hypothetical protein
MHEERSGAEQERVGEKVAKQVLGLHFYRLERERGDDRGAMVFNCHGGGRS